MKELDIHGDYDAEKVTAQITGIMSKWSIQFLDIDGPDWTVYDYDGKVRYIFHFLIDFRDLESRIKIEDLKLNVIHHIQSLKDETDYRDNLINADCVVL